MRVEVIRSIEDKSLQQSWLRLEAASRAFPQSSYAWARTWWQHLRGQRQLYVLVAYDEEGRATAIAPLCLERRCGLRFLSAFPIQFGDFYTFIGPRDGGFKASVNAILDRCGSFQEWDVVCLGQIGRQDPLHGMVAVRRFHAEEGAQCITAPFQGHSWETYLTAMSRTMRRDVRRKMRRIEQGRSVRLREVRDPEAYLPISETLSAMYAVRWCDDFRPEHGEAYERCVREAISEQLGAGRAVIYLLEVDGRAIAYRMGLLHNGLFYDWKTSFDVEWSSFSPGLLVLAYVVKELLERKAAGINFMAGRYGYKDSWSPFGEVVANDWFLASGPRLAARAYLGYRRRARKRLRSIFHYAMRFRWARFLSRKTWWVRRWV